MAAIRDRRRREWNGNVGHAAVRQYGLKLDRKRLDESEVDELVALAWQASGENKIDLTLVDVLPKNDRRKLEALLEKAAGQPDWFSKQREEATMLAKVARLAWEARKPGRRVRYEQLDSVTLPARLVRSYLDGDMDACTFLIAVDAVVHAQVVGGDHVIEQNPLARHDPDGLISGAVRGLKSLAEADWLSTDRIGGNRTLISYGPWLIRSFDELARGVVLHEKH